MSAEVADAKQPSKEEEGGGALATTNDLPEIKFPYSLKWFLHECYVRGGGPFHKEGEMPTTRFYQIPGFPGLKYNLTIRFNYEGDSTQESCEDSDEDSSEASDGSSEEDFDSLRVTLMATSPKYKNYKVKAKWIDRISCTKDKKKSRELNDNVQHFDQKEYLYFPEAYKMCAFFHAKGTFTIKQIYTVDVEIESVRDEHRALLGDEAGKDFILVAGKKEIKIHKSVLIHNSPVFAAAVVNEKDWKEGAERKYAIPDFSHKIVQIAVSVIYGQAYADALTKEEYVSLFQFADKYQMDELKKAVKESIILTPHNICEYLNLCHSKSCDELLDYCLEYMLIFSQNGYPINDKGLLNPDVKLLYADRAMKEPLKHLKTPKNNYYSFLNESKKFDDFSETDAVGMACSDLN